MKLAKPTEINSETRELLQEIADHCDTCQRYSSPPLRFKASIPDESELVFGDELSIDLMFLDSKAVLHIVDTATRFSAATFLDSHGETYGQSVDGIWLAFCMTWCTMYTGYPNRLRTDQGSVFTSDRWRQIAESNGIQLRLSGVKAHSSLGIGEKLHGPLRRIYNKVVASHPTLPKQFCLRIANKAMNDTIGENGLVPSKLVFGIIPRYPILNTDLPNQKERMEAIKLAQAEMNSIIAERRVLAALTKKIPPAADRQYNLGEEVLIYDEKVKEWVGPAIVVDCTGRMVTVRSKDGKLRQTYNAFQVKPYYKDLIVENYVQFKSNDEDSNPIFTIQITEVISPQDPRAWKFGEAIRKEIKGLVGKNTWRIVLQEEFPDDDPLNGRFVLAIKDEGTDKEIWKARFVVLGHKDKLKKLMVHDINVSKQYTIKLIIALAAIFGFRIFSTDVIQSYLQSLEKLSRNVLVKPTKEIVKELNLKPNELLLLLKPLYGLTESGDCWGRSFKYHLNEELGM